MIEIWSEPTEIDIKSNQSFVLMPFTEEWSGRIWEREIRPIVTKFGMRCIRADDLYGQDIMQDIARGIRESRIILAEITGRNPNVMYELGAAHALSKDVIILTQDKRNIPFDLLNYRCVIYKDNADGYDTLEREIPRFLEECLFSGLTDNFGYKINNKDNVVLFVSYGGTCRCAMANAITRFYLRWKDWGARIRPVSCGLVECSEEYASSHAQQVTSDQLGISLENHRTLRADFSLLKRADLILPTDERMVGAIVSQFQDKTRLLSRFFGLSGTIEDPYGSGYQGYTSVFLQIRKSIENNIDNLNRYFEELDHGGQGEENA